MQQADYHVLPSAHSMNARKCVHAQKSYPSQTFAHESSKVEGRGMRETEKADVRRLVERKAAQQNKNLSKELKQGLPTAHLRLTNQGEERKCQVFDTEYISIN